MDNLQKTPWSFRNRIIWKWNIYCEISEERRLSFIWLQIWLQLGRCCGCPWIPGLFSIAKWVRMLLICYYSHLGASQVGLVVKNSPANAVDVKVEGLISGSGRSPGREHGKLLQCSCLENPMDRGAWQSPWGHRVRHDWSDLAHSTFSFCVRMKVKGEKISISICLLF